jgi:hypothetical protein
MNFIQIKWLELNFFFKVWKFNCKKKNWKLSFWPLKWQFKFNHHKVHGSWFGNNFHWKFVFQTFVWNRYKCHSFICIVWTLMLCTLFRHGCCISIHVIYTQKSCTWLLCLNNAQHSCLNNMNLWNNKFRTNLEWTHEAYKFVMVVTSWWFGFVFFCD